MDREVLIEHLKSDHAIRSGEVDNVISGDPLDSCSLWYMRGFHDGIHGRVDALSMEHEEQLRKALL